MLYLIHFDRPFKHARHYLGFVKRAEGLDARLALHRSGNGARLLRALNLAGIGWRVVKTWPDGTQAEERRLKTQRAIPRLHCPVCREALKAS
jgi:hypothetical protein